MAAVFGTASYGSQALRFFFSSRRRHTRLQGDWSSDVCSSDLDALSQRRADLIMMNVTGNPDGSTAVDYTLNCAVGFPFVTGAPRGVPPADPVNQDRKSVV